MEKVKLTLALIAVTLTVLPSMVRADEPPAESRKGPAWSIALRFGGFSDSGGRDSWHPPLKYAGYNFEPQVASGIDISRFFGRRNGVSLSLDGLTFAGDAVMMAPITLTYKYFPVGNGLLPEAGKRPPTVQPWIGVGAGAFAVILDDTDLTRTDPGAQASTGLYVRLGRHFDFLGELRYAVTSDANVFLYTLGFGARF
jgi:hypothetical protein